jgi:hypothetical protein
LEATKGPRWLCIFKFNGFMLNGLMSVGGRLPTLSILTLPRTTLRQGYNIKMAANGFCGPPISQAIFLEQGAEGF